MLHILCMFCESAMRCVPPGWWECDNCGHRAPFHAGGAKRVQVQAKR